jgi:hypothetical protein
VECISFNILVLTLFLQANTGESLLRGDHDYDKDIRDLGVIVKRLAEPNELKLPTLADFLHRVERGETASDLLQVRLQWHCGRPKPKAYD